MMPAPPQMCSAFVEGTITLDERCTQASLSSCPSLTLTPSSHSLSPHSLSSHSLSSHSFSSHSLSSHSLALLSSLVSLACLTCLSLVSCLTPFSFVSLLYHSLLSFCVVSPSPLVSCLTIILGERFAQADERVRAAPQMSWNPPLMQGTPNEIR